METQTVLAFPLLASACGLVAFLIVVVGVIRFIDRRVGRTTRPAGPKAVPPAGPPVVPRVAAGCAITAMFPLALMALYLAGPEVQRLIASGKIGVPHYLMLGFAVTLFAGLLVWLVRTFRGPKSGPRRAATRDIMVTPRERRLIAGVVPVALLALGMAAGLLFIAVRADAYGITPGTTKVYPPPMAVFLGVVLLAVMFMVARHLLSRWAYPDWWAHRDRLLYPDTAAKPAVPPIPAPSPAPTGPCPRCGQSLAAGAPQGLCPRCLLQGVMPSANRPSPTLAFVEAYVAPPVEDVAKLFPHLEVIELVGQGGMGAVYKARQPALDRFVALKLVRPRDADPTFAERFVREAKAMARLNHPHVVAVYESGEAGGLPYLVMEYVDGVTLRDAMRERKLAPAEALAIVPQVCDALEYAHSQGVVHRDVKPENILVGRDGRVKIADFGLAKVTDPAGVSLTGTRQAMGTPHYMAPEQWEKPGEVDHRADIYALGVVLYELLTGELPLGRFDPPSQKIRLDVRLDGVVLRALAKEPDRRYQHAGDIRTALDAILSGSGGWARTPTFREYRSKRTFLGLPLVHVVSGRDPVTGRPKVATGWLAIGDAGAVGGVALSGGWAVGGVAAAGGFAVGALTLAGGFTLGFLAMAGGLAFGLLAAVAGGVAVAQGLAISGGFAAAWQFALAGGIARARWAWGSDRHDPGFGQQLGDWLRFWEADLTDG